MARCRYCGEQGVWRPVLVGKANNRRRPMRVMDMLVSTEPVPDGRVMVREDGSLRLALPATTIPPHVVTYAVHSARACAGMGAPDASQAQFLERLVRREVAAALDAVGAR